MSMNRRIQPCRATSKFIKNSSLKTHLNAIKHSIDHIVVLPKLAFKYPMPGHYAGTKTCWIYQFSDEFSCYHCFGVFVFYLNPPKFIMG